MLILFCNKFQGVDLNSSGTTHSVPLLKRVEILLNPEKAVKVRRACAIYVEEFVAQMCAHICVIYVLWHRINCSTKFLSLDSAQFKNTKKSNKQSAA